MFDLSSPVTSPKVNISTNKVSPIAASIPLVPTPVKLSSKATASPAGTFESAEIFPAFNDTLRLQEDYSLGFTRKTPDDGFAIYGGKGKYYNDIHLSHNGLKGNGDFEYLTAKASAEEILFFPDSTNLYAQKFTIDEVVSGIEFPQVSNTETYAHFMPYKDKLEIEKRKDEFDFYKGEATFNGNLLIQPTGVSGGGIMTLDKAEVNSNLFTYNASWFGSDTASLNVFESGGAIAFKANNLRTHIDMKMREGVFHSNGSGSFVELPANQYICYIDKLKWAMDEELLTLGDELASSSKGSEFISVHPHQDSLSFMATTANYSLRDYIIHANGVEDIAVADAIIYPDSGIVTVEKRAVIQTLYGATILADDLTEYHTFTNASVDIASAHNYKANADYTYTDAMNQKQQIFFKEIRVGEDTITIARGDVESDKPLHIDSKFDFKGSLDLFADRKNLIFDGYFMANHSCKLFDKQWVKFRSEIDPKNIIFTLDEKLYNDEQDLISNGLFMSLDSTDIYSTFLSRKDRAIDADLLNAYYTLSYDKKQFAYVVGGPDTLSNYFILYDKTCKTKGEGVVDLNLDLGQVYVTSVGGLSHDLKNKNNEFEGFFLLDFFFSEKAMEVMAKDIYSAPGDGMFEYDESYSNNLGRIVGKEKGDMLMLDLELKDEFDDFPKEMSHTLSFTKAKFKWDNVNKAYVAKGDLWLGNINDIQLYIQKHISNTHIVMMSDSCYFATETKGNQISKDKKSESYQKLLERRAVIVVGSGSNEPVSDTSQDKHSMFGMSFIQSLRNNTSAIRLRDIVDNIIVAHSGMRQQPYGGGIPAWGHSGGDFIFIRK